MKRFSIATKLNRNGRWQWIIAGPSIRYESYREYITEAAALRAARRKLREFKRDIETY
jgi:hypothetical protein